MVLRRKGRKIYLPFFIYTNADDIGEIVISGMGGCSRERKNNMLKISDVRIDNASIGEMVLCDVGPVYAYGPSNERLDKIVGYKYTCACIKHGLRKIAVKIESAAPLAEVSDDDFERVEFENLVVTPYMRDRAVYLSAKADAIRVVE